MRAAVDSYVQSVLPTKPDERALLAALAAPGTVVGAGEDRAPD